MGQKTSFGALLACVLSAGAGAAVLAACAYDFDQFEPARATDAAISNPQPEAAAPNETDAARPADASPGIEQDATPDAPPVISPDASDAGDAAPSCTEPGGRAFGGHCYFPSTPARNWDSARAACEGAGAHLVSITSRAEATAVQAISPTQDRWIGLRRPNGSPSGAASFVWTTGEPVALSDWAAGEPNGSGECARLRNGGQWGDQTCAATYTAICERE